MKNKTKFISILFVLSTFSFTRTYAQYEDKVPYMAGFTVEVPVFPLGDFKKTNKLGYGFGLAYDRGIGEKVAATINGAYLHFSRANPEYQSVYQIPIQVGAKYYFYDVNYGLYLKAELGLHFYNTYDSTIDPSSGMPKEKTGSGPGFAPSFGLIGLNNIELNFRYQVVSVEGESLSYISIKIAYIFARY